MNHTCLQRYKEKITGGLGKIFLYSYKQQWEARIHLTLDVKEDAGGSTGSSHPRPTRRASQRVKLSVWKAELTDGSSLALITLLNCL